MSITADVRAGGRAHTQACAGVRQSAHPRASTPPSTSIDQCACPRIEARARGGRTRGWTCDLSGVTGKAGAS